MYQLVLIAHSWLRWVALVAGVIATASALTNSPRAASSRDAADRWGLILMIALDVQLLLGLSLYFGLSPNTRAMFNDFGSAMSDPIARFWAVEHVCVMLLAIVLAHAGRVLGRKAATPEQRRLRLVVCFALATILMVAAIPWPGMRAGRPLFRM
jgi:hypothetical protein